jgi:hypothetical protein
MPDSYPGISLDQDGVCNLCHDFKKKEPLGEELLLESLSSKKGERYDCIVGISGGKDSCYVAYLAKEKYKLRALAVFYDSPFYCDLARENVSRVCKKLNMDLKTVASKDDLEYRLLQNHIISVGATGTSWGMCRFCHYGIDAVIYSVAREMKIPFNLTGVTKYERWNPGDRKQIMMNRVKKLPINDLLRFLYYQSKAYLLLVSQRRQFRMPCNSLLDVYKAPTKPSNGPVTINLFEYVRWDPGVIEKTLMEKTGWIKPKGSISWGYDCSLEPFLDYTYKKEFGISTVGLYLSHLIRDGMIERDKALEILEESDDEGMLKEKLDSVFDFLKIPKTIRAKFFATQ